LHYEDVAALHWTELMFSTQLEFMSSAIALHYMTQNWMCVLHVIELRI